MATPISSSNIKDISNMAITSSRTLDISRITATSSLNLPKIISRIMVTKTVTKKINSIRTVVGVETTIGGKISTIDNSSDKLPLKKRKQSPGGSPQPKKTLR